MMVLTFILDGEVPAKKNSRILNTKTRHIFPNKTYRQWQVIPEITVKNGYQKGNAKVVIKITGEQKSIG